MLGTILVNVVGIKIWIDIETKLGFLDISLDGSNGGSLEGIFPGGSLGST